MYINYTKPLTESSIESLLEKKQDEISWYDISRYQKLSEAFIEKYQDRINWIVISQHQKLSEEFIEKHQDKVDWKDISYYQTLSELFIEKFKNKVVWSFILQSQNLSEAFIKKYQDKIGYPGFCGPNKVDNRLLEEKMQDMQAYAQKYNLEIKDNYLYAYRQHDKLGKGKFNKTIIYDKPGIYRDWKCDLVPSNENSYGLGIFPKGNVLVRIHVNDWGIWVKDTNKARVWAFELL